MKKLVNETLNYNYQDFIRRIKRSININSSFLISLCRMRKQETEIFLLNLLTVEIYIAICLSIAKISIFCEKYYITYHFLAINRKCC